MSLREYLRQVHDLLCSSRHMPAFSVSFDDRSPTPAFLHGNITRGLELLRARGINPDRLGKDLLKMDKLNK